MGVVVPLKPKWVHRLLTHIPPESEAYGALEDSVDLFRLIETPSLEYVVECNVTEARLVLETAKEHCPEAVPAIEEALRNFRSPRS
jgi:hypothetical protein